MAAWHSSHNYAKHNAYYTKNRKIFLGWWDKEHVMKKYTRKDSKFGWARTVFKRETLNT